MILLVLINLISISIIIYFWINYKKIFKNSYNKYEIKIETPFKYIYKKKLFEKDECKEIIKYIESNDNLNWTNYGTLGSNNDLNISELNNKIQDIILFRIIELLYKISTIYNVEMNDLELLSESPFIIKYDETQKDLKSHKDNSDISFVILLNDDFKNGGTYFNDLDETLELKIGEVLIFPGQLVHSAKPITLNKRYVLSGFININPKIKKNQRLMTLKTHWIPH
jgi:hypothetical protein